MDALLPCILTKSLLSVLGVALYSGQRAVNVSSGEINWIYSMLLCTFDITQSMTNFRLLESIIIVDYLKQADVC